MLTELTVEGANLILRKELDSKAHAMLVSSGRCERLERENEKNVIRHEELKTLLRGDREAFTRPLAKILAAVETSSQTESSHKM